MEGLEVSGIAVQDVKFPKIQLKKDVKEKCLSWKPSVEESSPSSTTDYMMF